MEVWLCDLTYDQQVLASDTFPANVAYVGSYLLDRSKHRHTVRIFKYPGKLLAELEKDCVPDIIGLTHFMWNARLSYAVAEEIKAMAPHVVTVFGGLNYPNEEPVQTAWLDEHPKVDFHVFKEGEVAFQTLVDALVDHGMDVDAVRSLDLPGIHCRRKDGSHALPPPAERLSEIHSFPSPYLSGMLDEFFDGRLMPLISTNRGCPFTCAFCAEGQKYYNRVHKIAPERVLGEIEYIGKKMSGLPADSSRRDLYITDSNFGMYKEDLVVARALREARDRFGWPTYIKATTGKNKKELILDVARTLEGTITVAGSVQSLDDEVLANIRRTNIRKDALLEMALEAEKIGANSYSDVILGLPGDSLERHMKTVNQLIDAGFDYLVLYQLRLQNDCEMATRAYREEFGLKGRFRVLNRSYGSYPYRGRYINTAEVEEVCVEGINLPFEDYLKAREFDLAVAIFYYDRIFEGITKLLRHLQLPCSRWILEVSERIGTFEGLRAHVAAFVEETRNELFATAEDLVRFTQDRDIIKRYLSGDLGANLMGKYRILAVTEYFEDICKTAALAAKQVAAECDASSDLVPPLIDELIEFERQRKAGLYDPDLPDSTAVFSFDVPRFLAEDSLGDIRDFRFDEPTSIHFRRSEKAREIMRRNAKVFGSDNIMARYKQWTRSPWKWRAIYRQASYQ